MVLRAIDGDADERRDCRDIGGDADERRDCRDFDRVEERCDCRDTVVTGPHLLWYFHIHCFG